MMDWKECSVFGKDRQSASLFWPILGETAND